MPQELRLIDKMIQWANALSLVVVLGAISTAYFTSNLFSAQLDFSFYWLLGSTVWVIYTLDHLIDARNKEQSSLSFRHQVHKTWKQALTALVSGIVLFNVLVIALYAQEEIVLAGLALSAFVILYFLTIAHPKMKIVPGLKEVGVALGAVAGMVVLPAVQGGASFDLAFSVYVGAFFFLNLCNLTIFSLSDSISDQIAGFYSIATQLGTERTKQISYNLLAVCFLLFGCWTFLVEHPVKMVVAVVFLSMMHTLGFLLIQFGDGENTEKVRFWGDFIYVLPTPIWWLLT